MSAALSSLPAPTCPLSFCPETVIYMSDVHGSVSADTVRGGVQPAEAVLTLLKCSCGLYGLLREHK